MSLNTSNIFTVLQSLDYAANCAIAIQWLDAQVKYDLNRSLPINETLNIVFLQSALPSHLRTTNKVELSDFYNYIDSASPHVWVNTAMKTIQTECIVPILDKTLTFENLDLTRNCTATAAYFANSMCAISGPQHPTSGSKTGWIVNNIGKYKWITALVLPSQNLTSTSGISMLRNALPSGFKNLSRDELKLWARYSMPDIGVFNNSSQIAGVCNKCMVEFCLAASFTGNPDIAGPGAIASYIMGSLLVILSATCWVLGRVINLDNIKFLSPWLKAAKRSRRALAGCAMGLSLSLSVALLFMEFTSLTDDIGSYYQLNIAMSATSITCNTLFVFIIMNYRLFDLSGIEFERLATVAVCLTDCLFVLATFALIFTIHDKGFEFGDKPCFVNQLGSSVLNNPFFGSMTFFVPALLARIILTATVMVKRITARKFLSRQSLPYENPISARKSDKMMTSFAESYPSWYSALSHAHFFIASLCTLSLCLEVVYMLRLREVMKQIGGNAWSEGQMGFGQVLALLLWMPVIIVFIFSLGDEYLNYRATGRRYS